MKDSLIPQSTLLLADLVGSRGVLLKVDFMLKSKIGKMTLTGGEGAPLFSPFAAGYIFH